MAKGAQTTPKPNPKGKNIADKFGEFSDEYLQFSKDRFQVAEDRQKELDDLTQSVISKNMELGDLTVEQQKQLSGYNKSIADRISNTGADFTRRGTEMLDRYDKEFVPLEQDIVGFARNYDTPERRAEAAAKAKADVMTAADDQRATAARRSAAMGVNPNSGRFAGIERAGDLATQLASVGAQNTARENVENKGIALRSDAAQLGRSLQSAGANLSGLGVQADSTASGIMNTNQQLNNTASQIAMNAGTGAIGLRQQSNQLFDAGTQNMQKGYLGASQLLGDQANVINMQDQALLDRHRIDQTQSNNNSNGLWSAIGTGVGWFLSDENKKKNKTPISEGAALDAVENMRIEGWEYNEGVADDDQHVGTYAQDFQEQTGLGDGTKINVQDAIGVTMKAVQDLSHKVDNLATGIYRDPKKKKKNRVSSSTRDKELARLEANNSELMQGMALGTKAA